MSLAVLRADARCLPLPDASVDLIVTSPPPEVLAYLAGIIDADGCIRVSKTKPYTGRATPSYHARVHVRMVEREAIDLLDATFGGHVWTQKPSLMHGRTGISVDRSADYCRLAVWRTRDPAERARAMQVPKPPPVPDGMEPLFT